MNIRTHTDSAARGFSLVELLTVIAVIGILAAVLFPVVGKVRESAGETAGRAQFGQWAQAFELFRQEYGYYPDFSGGGSITQNDLLINRSPANADGVTGSFDGDRFYEVLAGRVASGGRRGERLQGGGSADDGYRAGNSRSAVFYSFGEGEVEETGGKVTIRDRFGNADIVVLFDRDQNGIIELSGSNPDYTVTLPKVRSARTGEEFDAPTIPTNGIRAGVIFYSAGYGNRLLTSWE